MSVTATKKEKRPTINKYVKVLRFFLYTVGAWPGEILGEKEFLFSRVLRKYIPLQALGELLSQAIYIVVNWDEMDMFTTGNNCVTAFLTTLTIVRISMSSFKQYRVITRNFLTTFHLDNFNHKTEYSTKMHAKVEKISYYWTIYAMALMILATLFFNVTAFYNNCKNGVFTGVRTENTTYEYAINYIIPGFNQDNYFLLASFINVMLTYNCAVAVCGVDLLLTLMVFQLIGHIQILSYDLENMPMPKKQILVDGNFGKGAVVEMFDEEENEMIHRLLTEYVDHHRLIAQFATDMTEFFGPLLALNYTFQLVSCCLLLLECSQGDLGTIFRFAPLSAIIFGQLIQISTIFEILATASEKLMDSVYWTPWECMNTRNRKTMSILLHRLQTPIRVFAMGLTPVGVTTMAGVLKTTFSYYAFLRSSSTN